MPVARAGWVAVGQGHPTEPNAEALRPPLDLHPSLEHLREETLEEPSSRRGTCSKEPFSIGLAPWSTLSGRPGPLALADQPRDEGLGVAMNVPDHLDSQHLHGRHVLVK